MSGIYIPGMEIPTCCETCILDHKFFKWLECKKHVTGDMIVDGRRSPSCPLVPVQDHGRLIDADALPTYDKPIGKMMMFGGEYVYTQTAIDNAPTIIPASGGTDNE